MDLISIETIQLGSNRCGLPGTLASRLHSDCIGAILPRIRFPTFSQMYKQTISRQRDAMVDFLIEH
jgi:hypothetical protein